MKFFLDTANIDEIRQANEWGILDGITTNPSLAAKEAKPFRKIAMEIVKLLDPRPVSLETVSLKKDDIIREARILTDFGPNVIAKIPLIPEGLMAVKALSDEGIRVNVTLIFSASQALMAAKAGAYYVSPFLGRLDDISEDGMVLIEDIRQIFDNYEFETEILAASIRHPLHIVQAAKIGADIATMPFNVMNQLFKHPLTDIGLERFLNDWKKVSDAKEIFAQETTPAS